jgi:hypothetical protein
MTIPARCLVSAESPVAINRKTFARTCRVPAIETKISPICIVLSADAASALQLGGTRADGRIGREHLL